MGLDIDAYADLLNVFDGGTVTIENEASFLNTQYHLQERRAVRLGVEFRY